MKKKQSCIICRKPSNDGIIINRRGMCRQCEERLLKIDVNTDFYEYYKECIKRNIVDVVLKGEDIKCQDFHF